MKKKHIAISLAVLAAVLLVGGCSADGGTGSSITETTPVPVTKAPETTIATTPASETKSPETKKPETTATTTKAPETTTTATTTTTKAPEWTEEKISTTTMYISVDSCYAREKAVLGAATAKLYYFADEVSVVAKTNTAYYKLKDGTFIHSDYLVSSKPQATTVSSDTPVPETSNGTNYGKTNSGDEILGYTGNGDAIIGYIPDIDMPFIGEGKDEHGEYYIIGWSSDGTPIIYYKDPELIIDDTSMGHIDWES